MKLLIYSHFFAPSIGGVETIVLSLARGLAELHDSNRVREFEITVVTQTLAGNYDDRTLPFRVIRQPSFFQLWQLIGEADRTLLAGPAILPLLFSRLRGKDAVVMHQGYQAICPNGMLFQFSPQTNCPGHFAAGRYGECLRCNAPQEGWAGSLKLLLLTFVRRSLATRATANVGASEHVAKRIALARSHVIRNAAIDQGAPTVSARPAGDSHPEVRFAYLGRLVTEKGVKVLLEAARLLAQEGFTPPILIIGDGPERSALEQQKGLLQLGANLAFLGFQRGPALEEQLKRVSVLVMPSLCEDVAPLSVLEMMMQGRLIIGSMIGGLAEEMGDAGLTFEPGNATALAERMRQVIEQPHLIETLGRQARERALAWYTLQPQLIEYRELLRAR
jgi:glycosyltransferase involved in cell wall biosynthesis